MSSWVITKTAAATSAARCSRLDADVIEMFRAFRDLVTTEGAEAPKMLGDCGCDNHYLSDQMANSPPPGSRK